jgi:ATP-dependent DNA helicase RecQ
MRSPRVYISGFSRANLSFQVFVESGKTQSILRYIKKHEGTGIIYAATRKSVDEIYDFLRLNGVESLRYHAGLIGEERMRSQMEFLNSDCVMVATNAFGMGINKANVRYIIHYEIPGTLEAYYQEAGRAGRDGELSECILFFHKRDLEVQEYFVDSLYPPREELVQTYNSIFDSLSIHLGEKPEDYLTVDVSKIAGLTKLSSRKINSIINILAQSGLIQLVPSVSATAYVRSKVGMDSFKDALAKTSSQDTKLVLDTLLRLYGSSVFLGRQAVTLEELSHKSDLDTSAVSRTLSILQRSGILEYTPPSEGIRGCSKEGRTNLQSISTGCQSSAKERTND